MKDSLLVELGKKIRTVYYPNGYVKSEILDGLNYLQFWGNGQSKQLVINGKTIFEYKANGKPYNLTTGN
jgi:hypothetical protein